MLSPGCWRRAGLAGIVTGIDLAAGLDRLDTTGLDVATIRQIAAEGEAGLMRGLARRGKEDR